MGRVFTVVVGIGVLVVACGGSSGSTIGTNESPSDGGASDTGSGTTYTLDNVCDATAPKVCAVRKPCCEKTFGYDETACITHQKADCAKDVADAKAGLMTFHPERIDGCLTQLPILYNACFLDVNLLEQVYTLASCRVFEGQTAVGAQCTRDSQCAPAADSTTLVECDDTKGICKNTRLLHANDTCRWGDDSPGFCAKGTYCDAPIGGGADGHCVPATKNGAPCNTSVTFSPECGLGSYCDKTLGNCETSKGIGETCTNAFACLSLKCGSDNVDAGLLCQKGDALVKTEECK